MKTIIAGSRTIANLELVERAVAHSGIAISEVVSGCARGVDKLGERYAEKHSIPVKPFPAEWNKFGKAAGPIRNAQMARYADALIAVWDGRSRGTKHMIEQARKYGLKVVIRVV